jgi:hypothetical protein
MVRGVAIAMAAAALLSGATAAAGAAGGAVADPTPAEAAGAADGIVRAVAEQAADIQAALGVPERERTPSLTDDEVLSIAATSGELQDWIEDRELSRTAVELDEDTGVHTAFYVSEDEDGDETVEAQALVDDASGEITEVRVGPQVAWSMARGYDRAFGGAVTDPEIWLPLSALFLVPLLPFARPRRLLSWRTLDLLVLLSFGVSLIWFNRGEIFTSVPLSYPPMVYLGGRLAWIAIARARAARQRPPGEEAQATAAPDGPRRPVFGGWLPTWLLASLLVAALALRFGLNAFDSGVIDVGYAGVVGADLIAHGDTPYDNMPGDCGTCDTYGPLTYITYVPFELAQPWEGTWDSLPAAHGAASLFDVLCVAGMFALGWSVSGLRLGLGLALAWAAFPFTAFALETNSNDSLVAAALVWGLVVARHPLGRGLMLGLALASKFAPAVLLPLWSRRPFPRGPGGPRALLGYGAGLAGAVLLTGWVLLLDGLDGLTSFWSRTVGYQLGRDSPFSIWGQHPGLRPVQIALMALVGIAALVVLRWPRRLDLLTMAALSGALLVAAELTLTHWFYLYIPWFLPFALLAMVPDWPPPRRAAPGALDPARAPEREPLPAVPAAAR